MVLGEDSGTAIENRPVTPRENEDLLTMLRTRWADGAFSDIKVIIFDREYFLHRMVLCRSPFFDRLLQGEWNETNERVLRLEVPAATITCEAFEMSLSHMYANPIGLNQNNVFQVMAAASYLDLQDLCAQCSEFIIDSMHDPDSFLDYYRGGTEYEYGPHSDRIKKSGWHHLCMMGVDHLRKVLPSLDIHTVKRLLVSDEFWVRTELDRYKLVKEVLFPKVFAARERCKEHGGIGGMPLWSNPSLGSPRDPWIIPDAFGHSHEKSDTNSNNQGSSSSNQAADTAEIREDTSGSESQGSKGEPSTKSEPVETVEHLDVGTVARTRPGSSVAPMLDDHSSQGDNVQETRMEEDVTESAAEQHPSGSFGLMEAREERTEHLQMKEAAIEVRDIFHAVSDVLGLEGIKYSHIQHAFVKDRN